VRVSVCNLLWLHARELCSSSFYIISLQILKSRVSEVGISTDYGLDDQDVAVPVPVG
jgi:hypothetical protein